MPSFRAIAEQEKQTKPQTTSGSKRSFRAIAKIKPKPKDFSTGEVALGLVTPFSKANREITKGIGKGALSTVKGASGLGERAFNSALKTILPKSLEDNFALEKAPTLGWVKPDMKAKTIAEKLQSQAESKLNLKQGSLTTPTNKAQKLGFAGEQIGEFFVPGSASFKLGKALSTGAKVSKLGKAAIQLGATGATEGVLGTGQSALQSGKLGKEEAKIGALSAAGTVALSGAGRAFGKLRKTPENIASQIDSLEEKYIEIATNQQGLKRKLDKAKLKTEWKNKAGTEGTDPARTLAENGIIPKQSGSRIDTFEQANEFRATTNKLRNINRTALEEVDKSRLQGISLDEYKKQAIARAKTPQNIDRGVADDLVADIEKSVEAYKREYGNFISLTKLDDIKSARWGDTKFDATKPLKSDVNYTLGKTAQNIIETTAKEAGFEDVAQLNRHIGDKLEAAKFLEDLNGKVVKGGRLGKYVMRGMGFGLGTNPLGKILGAIGGDAVANVLISNSIATPVKRRILNQLMIEDPKAYKEAVAWLTKNKVLPKNLERLALPPATARTEARLVGEAGSKRFAPAVEGTPNAPIPLRPPIGKSSVSTIPGQVQPVIPPVFRPGFQESRPFLPPGVTKKPSTNLAPTIRLPNEGVLKGQATLRGQMSPLRTSAPLRPPSQEVLEGTVLRSPKRRPARKL